RLGGGRRSERSLGSGRFGFVGGSDFVSWNVRELPPKHAGGGELRAGKRASRGTEVQGGPRQLRRGDAPLSGARSGESVARMVRVFPRRLPRRCRHVQDRTPASTDVGGPPQRSGMEPAPRRSVSVGGRFVPVRAGPKSRLRRRLQRPRIGPVRAGHLRARSSAARKAPRGFSRLLSP